MVRSCSSRTEKGATRAAVASVDPLSTTMISKRSGAKRWASSDWRSAVIVFARLYTGTITETSGVLMRWSFLICRAWDAIPMAPHATNRGGGRSEAALYSPWGGSENAAGRRAHDKKPEARKRIEVGAAG